MRKLYAFFDLDRMDRSILERGSKLLPPERRAKVARYRQEIDRRAGVTAYLLLLYGLYKNYGICTPRVAYSDKGKPFLRDYPDVHFNISHCPKGCICGISDLPIGVDIQDVRPFSQEIADRCCSADEQYRLSCSPDLASVFTQMWAMKESYLKMTGAGVTENLSAVDTTKLANKILTFMMDGCHIAVADAGAFWEETICTI